MPYGLPKFLCKLIFPKKKKLSYQSLRCVLEYLEANRRIHIAARCPDLQSIERRIPLHINKLVLGESQITINEVDHVLYKLIIRRDFYSEGKQIYTYDGVNYKPSQTTFDQHGEMTPGDILMKSQNETEQEVLANRFGFYDPPNQLNCINVTFKVKSKEVHHTFLPSFLKLHVAMKKLTTYLLGGRLCISVRTLVVLEHTRLLRLPMGVQFFIRELMTDFKYIDSLQPIIKEESIPLEILESHSSSQPLNAPIFQTAKMLVLKFSNLEDLLRYPNQKIHLKRSFFLEREVVEVVKHTLNSGRSIGTCYYFDFTKRGRILSLLKILELIKEQNIPEIKECWSNANDRGQLNSISFPINAASKVKISAGSGLPNDFYRNCFKIEVVPVEVVEPNQERFGARLLKFVSNLFGFFVNMD